MRAVVSAAIAATLIGGCQFVFPIDALTNGSGDAQSNDGGRDSSGDAGDTADVVLTSPDCGSLDTTQNCGRCGHDCLGAQCTKGTCVATQVYGGSTTELAYDSVSGKIFFGDGVGDGGDVYAIDPTTFQKSVVATKQGGPAVIAVRNPYVVWGNGDGSVVRALVDGGSPIVIVTGEKNIQCVAINSTTVFWADSAGVGTASLVDGGLGPPLPGLQNASCVAANDAWVAVAVDNGHLKQFALPTFGVITDSPLSLDTDNPEHGVAISSSIDGGGALYTAGGSAIHRFDLGDGAVSAPIARTSGSPTFDIIADPGGVFWVDNDGNGFVEGCTDPVCATGVLVYSHLDFPDSIATDGKYLYFTPSSLGGIYRVPR